MLILPKELKTEEVVAPPWILDPHLGSVFGFCASEWSDMMLWIVLKSIPYQLRDALPGHDRLVAEGAAAVLQVGEDLA